MCVPAVTCFLSRGIILYIQTSSTKEKVRKQLRLYLPDLVLDIDSVCFFYLLKIAEALSFYAN